MLHRHPFLSLLTMVYLGFVGLVTLTPGNEQPDYAGLAGRVLARLERYPDLDPLTSRLSVERIEFLANIGLFVPLGMFLLLLVGTRLWLVALAAGIVLTSMIEAVQREIPGPGVRPPRRRRQLDRHVPRHRPRDRPDAPGDPASAAGARLASAVGRVLAGRSDQSRHQPDLDAGLRVPLDGDSPAVAGRFHRLQGPVGRPRHRGEAGVAWPPTGGGGS